MENGLSNSSKRSFKISLRSPKRNLKKKTGGDPIIVQHCQNHISSPIQAVDHGGEQISAMRREPVTFAGFLRCFKYEFPHLVKTLTFSE